MLDALLQLALEPLNLARCEVALAVVDRLELAAVDGHHRTEQLQFAAQHDEAAADASDALAVVSAEVSNGLEVRRQAASEPHELQVALSLALQSAA